MSQNLTPKQVQAVSLLIQGHNQLEIAAILKIERRTLFRWRQLPAFNERLVSEVNAQESEILTNLKCLRTLAVDTLGKAMRGGSSPLALKSACEVLDRTSIGQISTLVVKTEGEKREAWNESLALLKAKTAKTAQNNEESSWLITP